MAAPCRVQKCCHWQSHVDQPRLRSLQPPLTIAYDNRCLADAQELPTKAEGEFGLGGITCAYYLRLNTDPSYRRNHLPSHLPLRHDTTTLTYLWFLQCLYGGCPYPCPCPYFVCLLRFFTYNDTLCLGSNQWESTKLKKSRQDSWTLNLSELHLPCWWNSNTLARIQ